MRRMPRQHQNRNVRRERDPRALTRQAVLLVCGLLLAVGFVLAARQKFVAINYGYESENLRRERERLKEEHRHLLLKLEETTTPAQLERAAREIGLQPTRAAQLSVGMEVTDTDATTPQRHASPAFVGATTGGAAAFRR